MHSTIFPGNCTVAVTVSVSVRMIVTWLLLGDVTYTLPISEFETAATVRGWPITGMIFFTRKLVISMTLTVPSPSFAV